MAEIRKAPQTLDEVDEQNRKDALKKIDFRVNTTNMAWDPVTGDFPVTLGEWDMQMPPGFLMIYGGKRRSGKSVHLRHWLYSNNPDQWQLALVMTNTPQTNVYQPIVGEQWVVGGWDPYLVQKLFAQGKKNVAKNGESHPKNKILLILDDIIGEGFHDDDVMSMIATRGRHFDISVILTTQYPHAIHPKVRTNSDVFIGFELDTQREYESVVQNYFYHLGKAAWALYSHHTTGTYTGMVSLKHAKGADPVKRYAITTAPPPPENELDLPQFEIGAPEQRQAARKYQDYLRERKSNMESQNGTSTDDSGSFCGRGCDGEASGSDITRRIHEGVSIAKAEY